MNYKKVWKKSIAKKFRGKLISQLDQWDLSDYRWIQKNKREKFFEIRNWTITIVIMIIFTYILFKSI